MTRKTSRELPLSDYVIPLRFAVLLPRRRSATKTGILSFGNRPAFTIIELLVVIAIIITLAGLILSTVGYVQKKGARSRAETEIAAISAALESYRADNGIYPTSADTNALDPIMDVNPMPPPPANKYSKASLYLYEQISGDTNDDRVAEQKSYFALKPAMLFPPPPATSSVQGIRDPFGNCYGYSTAKVSNPGGTAGYNPTFDLWSTAGGTTTNDTAGWIKNW
jgi:type II secretory pathway pseudopilin PulG